MPRQHFTQSVPVVRSEQTIWSVRGKPYVCILRSFAYAYSALSRDALESRRKVPLGDTHRIVPSGASSCATGTPHGYTTRRSGTVTPPEAWSRPSRPGTGPGRSAGARIPSPPTPAATFTAPVKAATPFSSSQPFAWSGSLDELAAFQCVTVASSGRYRVWDSPWTLWPGEHISVTCSTSPGPLPAFTHIYNYYINIYKYEKHFGG